MIKERCMTSRTTTVLVGVASFFAGLVIPVANAQRASGPVKVVQLTGLVGVKDNAKGTLSVENGQLHFVHGKASSDVSASSMQDVATAADSQRAVGSLRCIQFHTQQGAKTMNRILSAGFRLFLFTLIFAAAPLLAQKSKPTKIKAAALQVEMIQSDEIKLPAEFQVALYENLIRQLEKNGFSHVYRDGDRNAASIADLVVLHSTVRGFKAGSERARQVTTVSGATSITVHCQFTSSDGTSLLEQDVNGKVRFFGGNLKATYDFAKKAAHVANENFSTPDSK